jgi:hypothetical protein
MTRRRERLALMAFIEFFQDDDSGEWREQLQEILVHYPVIYRQYAKEKGLRPSRGLSAKEIRAHKIDKYERAAAACEEWNSRYPDRSSWTDEEQNRWDALERAVERAVAALQPQECKDCGTYCDGSCPLTHSQWNSLREDQYRNMVANVRRWAGTVTLQDRLRARLSVGAYRYTNTDAVIDALVAIDAAGRVSVDTNADRVTLRNKRGDGWSLIPADFVDCARSGVATDVLEWIQCAGGDCRRRDRLKCGFCAYLRRLFLSLFLCRLR